MCSKFSPLYTAVINVVFWTVSVVPAAFTVWGVQGVKTHEATPAPSSEDETGAPVKGEKESETPQV